MEWFTVVGLVLFGLVLIVLEVILIPGTTFVGIAGLISTIFGIYLGYEYFGNTTGTFVLIGSILAGLLTMVYALKSNSWERFSLKGEITSRFNDDQNPLEPGAEGETISSLKPVGKASFNDQEVEVRSNGGYIAENEKVKITRIESNKIFVELIKTT